MINAIASHWCPKVGDGMKTNRQGEIKAVAPNTANKVAKVLDGLVGITVLVLGILMLTVPATNVLGLSSVAQWALIAGGGAYTAATVLPTASFYARVVAQKGVVDPYHKHQAQKSSHTV